MSTKIIFHTITTVNEKVVIMMVVMSTKIIFHTITTVNEKVVMRVVIRTTIIVVNCFLAVIICNQKIIMDIVPLWDTWTNINVSNIHLSIPRIKRSMITTFTTSIKHQVFFHYVAPTKAIIKIDSSTRTIVENVSFKMILTRFGLEIKTRLFFPNS